MESRTVIMRCFRSVVLFFVSILASVFVHGEEWKTLNPPNSPEARFGYSMVTLADGRVVLFGGENVEGDMLNDLVTFTDNNWIPSLSSAHPPEPRKEHSFVTLSDGWFVLFGGEDTEANLLNDLVYFDGDDWLTEIPLNNAPPPRRSQSSWVYMDNVYIAGGVGSAGVLSDLWRYDTASKTWDQLLYCLGPLEGAAVASHEDRAYVLSYWEVDFYYDMTNDLWVTIPRTVPHPASRKYAAVSETGEKAYVMGGEGSVLNDTWEFDFATESWTQRMNMPVALTKSGAAMVGDQVLVFGGLREDGSVSGETYLYTPPGASVDDENMAPESFVLRQNYPNPFNPETTIAFAVKEKCRVILKVFDLHGREVATLVDAEKQAGSYSVRFDASGLASGIYYYQIRMKDFVEVRKMVLLE